MEVMTNNMDKTKIKYACGRIKSRLEMVVAANRDYIRSFCVLFIYYFSTSFHEYFDFLL